MKNKRILIIVVVCAIFVMFGLPYMLVKMREEKPKISDTPYIGKITPNNGSPEGGTKITITGGVFDQNATVNIGDKALKDVKVNPAGNVITGITPSNGEGKINIIVINQDGVQSNPSEFFIANIPEYTILEREVYDAPIKTQIELRLLVSGKLSQDGLKILFDILYSETHNKKGFKFHDHPTSIAIWAYISKKDADIGFPYVARLLWMEDSDSIPKIDIESDILAQHNASIK